MFDIQSKSYFIVELVGQLNLISHLMPLLARLNNHLCLVYVTVVLTWSQPVSQSQAKKKTCYVTIKRCILHTKIHYYMLSVKKEKKMFDLFQLCHQFHLFRGYYSNKIVTNKEKSLTGRVKLTKRLALFKWLIENIQDKNRESAMESLPGWLNQQRRIVIET